MTKQTPLVLGGEPPQAQPARRASRSQFANRAAVKSADKVQKPSQHTGLAAFGDGLFRALIGLVSIVAFTVAALATLYAVAPLVMPRLPFGLPPPSADISGNLLVGALFFWLEVSAIVLGLRLVDGLRLRGLVRRQLFFVQDHLAGCINEIDEARYDFAVNLDRSLTETGRYDTDLGGLNVSLGRLRGRFINDIYCDIHLTETAARMVARVTRTLDIFCQETYELARQAAVLNRASPPTGLEDCLNEVFERTDTGELRGLERMIDEVRRAV